MVSLLQIDKVIHQVCLLSSIARAAGHLAVARSADMLDVLLDSVDEQKPVIAEEERTAPVGGEASLEEREQKTIGNTHRP